MCFIANTSRTPCHQEPYQARAIRTNSLTSQLKFLKLALGLLASLCLVFVTTSPQDDASVTRQSLIAALYAAGLLAYAAGAHLGSLSSLLVKVWNLNRRMPVLPGS